MGLQYGTFPSVVQPQTVATRATRATSGSQVVYTIPATQDFYLCSASLVLSNDSAADNTSADLSATVSGSAVSILTIRKQTLTAYANVVVLTFNPPLKCDKNTTINANSTWTVGAGQVGGSISGYLV